MAVSVVRGWWCARASPPASSIRVRQRTATTHVVYPTRAKRAARIWTDQSTNGLRIQLHIGRQPLQPHTPTPFHLRTSLQTTTSAVGPRPPSVASRARVCCVCVAQPRRVDAAGHAQPVHSCWPAPYMAVTKQPTPIGCRSASVSKPTPSSPGRAPVATIVAMSTEEKTCDQRRSIHPRLKLCFNGHDDASTVGSATDLLLVLVENKAAVGAAEAEGVAHDAGHRAVLRIGVGE